MPQDTGPKFSIQFKKKNEPNIKRQNILYAFKYMHRSSGEVVVLVQIYKQ